MVTRDHNRSLSVMLLTDVFPPQSGGSGWSTYYLAKALCERGHRVRVLRPLFGELVARPTRRLINYNGIPVEELLVPELPRTAGRTPLNRALSMMAANKMMARRARSAAIRDGVQVLHGQHALSSVAASQAARRARASDAKVVSVATVRDYWPLCPTSTRLFRDERGALVECSRCHELPEYARALRRSRNGPLRWPLGLARWAQTLHASRHLARCDAVIAVSGYVRRELARSRRVEPSRLHTIPNLVDLPSVNRALAALWPLDHLAPGDPFLLYAGKWDANKGVHLLPEAVQRSGVRLPLVLAGDGPLREEVARDARSRGLDFRWQPWLDNDAVLLLMRRATALVFPSAWQEPLSRVLLEGCAAGAAIVALDTGGTRDVIDHMESGWLAQDLDHFAQGIAAVVEDPQLNGHLRRGARQRAVERFSAPVVAEQVEALYAHLLEDIA